MRTSRGRPPPARPVPLPPVGRDRPNRATRLEPVLRATLEGLLTLYAVLVDEAHTDDIVTEYAPPGHHG